MTGQLMVRHVCMLFEHEDIREFEGNSEKYRESARASESTRARVGNGS